MTNDTGVVAWWKSFDAAPDEDLAREEGLLEAAAGGSPQLFAFSWDRPALVLGYGQRDLSALDLEACRREGVLVLRRCTGGTAVFQRSDLSLSLALPSNHAWAGGIRGLYGRYLGCLQESLSSLGVEASRPAEDRAAPRSPICFEGRGEDSLMIGGKKVAGGAQARRRRSVLVHIVVLFSLDAEMQSRIFRVPRERIELAMAAVPARPALSRGTLAAAFAACLARHLGCSLDAKEAPPPLRADATPRSWLAAP